MNGERSWEDELKLHQSLTNNNFSVAPLLSHLPPPPSLPPPPPPTPPPPKEKRGSFFRALRSSKSSSALRSQSVSTQASSSKDSAVVVDAPKTPRKRLQKRGAVPQQKNASSGSRRPVNQTTRLGSNGYYDNPRVKLGGDGYERDRQTGEVIDHTEMLHTLAQNDSADQRATFVPLGEEEGTEDGQKIVDKLPPRVWKLILGLLAIADRAALSLSCHAFQRLTGQTPFAELALHDATHRSERLSFLPRIDRQLPGHLLCFDCGVYHIRTQRGSETLRPTNVLNPLYRCANLSNPKKINPRIRLTYNRALPFTFVQLAMRAHRYSLDYGIEVESLSRRYKDGEHVGTWSHQTRFVVVKGHLLMRVTSQTFAPPGLPPAGERHLLYCQSEDYVPFFSVCPHWRDGVLMQSVKCAIRHIPKPLEGSGINRLAKEVKMHYRPQNPVVTLCTECRPIRRCPECPTEYLIEVKMAEDRSDPTKLFKQALVVTRWSDLGDGISPFSPEWSACCSAEQGYDSFTKIGGRAVSGQFEAEVNHDAIPPQNMKSMNPDKKYLGEKGHDWY